MATPTTTQRGTAWALHVFTTLGVVVGMLALREVIVGDARMALIWLLVSFTIDGIDGPVARILDVKTRVPVIDGYILDVVIDYVTCVVVPAAFMYRFGLIPEGNWGVFLIGLIAFTSAIWFARTDLETDENWFRGFPAAWNLVVPVLYIFDARPVIGVIISIVLSVMGLTSFPFPHPVRVVYLRWLTLTVTIVWVIVISIGVLLLPDRYYWMRPILMLGSLYWLVIGIWQIHRLRTGQASNANAQH